jgi:hypothetical protein
MLGRTLVAETVQSGNDGEIEVGDKEVASHMRGIPTSSSPTRPQATKRQGRRFASACGTARPRARKQPRRSCSCSARMWRSIPRSWR